MKPIGLTFKNVEVNQYAGRVSGELMVVHECQGCGQISCNRIAGDDNNYSISCPLENHGSLSAQTTINLERMRITLLNQNDKEMALTSIYGTNFQMYLK